MTCPMCQGETRKAFRPFCSKRCADLDLGRWMTGGYAIAGPAVENADLTQESTTRMPDDRDDALT